MHGGAGEEAIHVVVDPELEYIKRWVVIQVSLHLIIEYQLRFFTYRSFAMITDPIFYSLYLCNLMVFTFDISNFNYLTFHKSLTI